MKITKDELKKRFRTGMYPAQADFGNLIDTLAGVDDVIDIDKIKNLESLLQDKASRESLEFHAANKSNPHYVTAEQVGLGLVDNTADVNKPISNATQEALDANMKLVESMRRDLLNNMYVDNFPGLMTTYEEFDRHCYRIDDWMSDGLNEMKKSLYDNSILKESTVDEKNTIYLDVEFCGDKLQVNHSCVYCFSVILEVNDGSKYIHNIPISTSDISFLNEYRIEGLQWHNGPSNRWLLSFVMPTREEFNAMLGKHSIIGYKEISGIAPYIYSQYEEIDPWGIIAYNYVKFNVYKGGNTILEKFKQICTNVDNVKKSLTLIDTDSKKRDLILENETRDLYLKNDNLVYIGEKRTGDGSGRNAKNVKALKDISIRDTRVFIIPFIDSDLDVSYLKHCEYITSFNRQTQYPNGLFLDIQEKIFDKDIIIENALTQFNWSNQIPVHNITFVNCELESCLLTDGCSFNGMIGIVKCIDCIINIFDFKIYYRNKLDLSHWNECVEFTPNSFNKSENIIKSENFFQPAEILLSNESVVVVGTPSLEMRKGCVLHRRAELPGTKFPDNHYQWFTRTRQPYLIADIRNIPDLDLKEFKGYEFPRIIAIRGGINAKCNKRSNWLQNKFIFPMNNSKEYEVTIDLVNDNFITSIFDKNENRDITWDPFVASNSVDDQMHGDLLIGKEKYPCLTIGIEDDLKTIVCYRNGFLSLNIAIDTFTIFPEGSMIDFDIVKNDIVIDTYSFKANQNKIKIELVEKVTAFDKIHVEIKSAIIGNSFGLIKIKTFAEYLNK